jgi:hypothetical protein
VLLLPAAAGLLYLLPKVLHLGDGPVDGLDFRLIWLTGEQYSEICPPSYCSRPDACICRRVPS